MKFILTILISKMTWESKANAYVMYVIFDHNDLPKNYMQFMFRFPMKLCLHIYFLNA